ncbi:TonB-dependent receptor [Flammeovirga pectinis]|uniref:TonB-dependent receptor n=1 Tax=Flammeovirga pectinis TaxID=2494373 RepID=A0A3Q9FR07_9BACT|nr:TonB-dependent receptor [Flammeovirga pectinis]AZQ64041.1 TonB-dependent receptor [Flammeovirga pectinis]
MSRLLLSFIVLFFLAQNVIAQSTTSVSGYIIDEDNLSLAGASVYFKGLENRGTISASDGKFLLVNLPAGDYQLHISYLGFETFEKNVELIEGQNLDLGNIILKGNFILGDEVVILGSTQRGQAKSLSQQKNSGNIINVISSDQVGKFPDANIGDAMKRVPGITMQYDMGEARFGLIRGTPAELSSVTINGERVPSAEGETRAVQLDLIPADMIQSIEVSKAVTPDMDADAIGGSANLVLRSAPVDTRISGTLGVGYNALSEEPVYNGGIVIGDRLFNDKLGIIVSGSYQNNQLGAHNYEAEWSKNEEKQNELYPEAFEIRKYDVQRVRQSVSANLDYKLGNNSKIFFTSMYNHRDDRENRFKLKYDDIEYDAESGTYTSKLKRETKGGTNGKPNDSRRLERQQAYNFTLGGDHLIKNLVKLTWSGTLAKASEERPNERYSVWEQKGVTIMNDPTDTRTPNINAYGAEYDYANFEFKEYTEEFQYTEEMDKNARLDLEIPLNESKNKSILKVGGRYRGKEKMRNNSFIEYDYADGFNGPQTLAETEMSNETPNNWMAGNYNVGNFQSKNQLGAYNFTNTSQFVGEDKPDEYLAGNYKANEHISAGYAMIKQSIGTEWLFIAGVRVENTRVNYTGNKVVFDENGEYDPSTSGITQGENNYTNILPSMHVRYNLSENSILRFAYTNTLARPRYYDLVPYQQINREDNEIAVGNPELKATVAQNFDLMFEHYMSNLGLVSGGVYYKSMSNFIYDFYERDVEVNGNVYDLYKQARNGDNAYLYGVEIAFQRQLDFLPGVLKNLSFYGNYTYSVSEMSGFDSENGEGRSETTPLPGTVPHTFNTSLSYGTDKLSVRVSFHYTSSYIDELGDEAFYDRYYDNQMFLDANASYFINDKFSVFAEANNLLNTPLRYYQGASDLTMQAEYYGPRYNLGLKFDLMK